ncbi:MAG TPA: Gfo/Idh/MocA family oxidoreductase [Solirubrobacterales bacterium]|nr:Gfo/Idh/MocA family oxidoreductase [Solirubrobacterales bacterium]
MLLDPAIETLVVGYGYWGPNIVRNVIERPEFRLKGLCERDDSRIEDFRRRHPGVRVERELDEALADQRLQAVAIATPPHTHYDLVRRALEAGKHVLVEKPLARTADEAAELIALAEDLGLVLMPGHTFLYSPSVNKVRSLIEEDVLGEIYFVTSSRMNLGLYQQDGVVLDLAPHDLSILLHWLNKPLVEVAASGRSVFREGVHETAFLTLRFEGGAQANVQLSWLAPRKMRQMVVVGSQRMVQYEDTAADDSVRVYDRGLDFSEPPANFGEYRLTYRTGDMVAPQIEAAEPLGLELKDFASAINEGTTPASSARLGLEVVLGLEALERSLHAGGESIPVCPVDEALARGRQRELSADRTPA